MPLDLFDLTGRRALVTGGSAGIGLAIARGLAVHGAEIMLWGRNAARAESAASALAEGGARILWDSVDVSDERAVIDGMTRGDERMGGLDTFVLNAGIGHPPTDLVDTTADLYRATMATNLDGAFWSLREASRLMVSRSRESAVGGSIIAVSSLAAIEGAIRNHAYGAAKAGLAALVRSSAVELARYGVRVNAVLPGWIATDMTEDSQQSEAVTSKVISRVPMRRWGRPDELAGIAVYLASDASSYQTGTTVVVDGGYSVF